MRAFLLLLLSLGSAWLQAAEHTWIAPAWTARNTPVVTVDSILLRDTLSRLYITLKQPPHTTLTLHDDWEIQDSLGNFTVRIKDVDGVDFNRIFQFDDDSTVAVEMDFPPLPASCSEFDLIGNKPSGAGHHLRTRHRLAARSLHRVPPAAESARRKDCTDRPAHPAANYHRSSCCRRWHFRRPAAPLPSCAAKVDFGRPIHPLLYRARRHAFSANPA